jgi:hypothetical protein
VFAIWVVLVSIGAVGAVGTPVNAGEFALTFESTCSDKSAIVSLNNVVVVVIFLISTSSSLILLIGTLSPYACASVQEILAAIFDAVEAEMFLAVIRRTSGPTGKPGFTVPACPSPLRIDVPRSLALDKSYVVDEKFAPPPFSA